MPTTPFIVSLADVSRADGPRVGGKGANLGELTRAGFRVPPGYCLTTAAYRRHLAAHDLNPLTADAATLRAAIIANEMPPAIAQTTIDAYRRLGGGTVAVRSSATAEDLPTASFAGQQDTFLNVEGEPALLDAVRRCWASLWSDRAVAYRRHVGLDTADVALAVVVQRMVPADVAGVAFSADPVTGQPDRVVIEAVRGLGEALVSGQVSPARAVVDRGIGQVTEQAPTPDGDPILTPDLVDQVADLAIRVEAHYSSPQDIEWAWADGTLHLLQARPITTLTPSSLSLIGRGHDPAQPGAGGEGQDTTLWTRLWSDEYWSGLASPLFYSIFGPMLSRYLMREPIQVMGFGDVADLPVIRLFQGHVYFNADLLKGVFSYSPITLRTDNLTSIFPTERAAEMKAAPFRLARRVRGEVRLAFLDPSGTIVRNYRRLEEYVPTLLQRLGELDALDLRRATPEEILHYFGQAEALGVEHCRIIRWGLVSHNLSLYNLLRYMLQNWCGDQDRSMLARLLAGVPGNKTLETNKALWDLAQTALVTPSVAQTITETDEGELLAALAASPAGQAFLQRLDAFLCEYGHRSVTRDIATPAWEDDPTLVLALVKRYLTMGAESNPYELEARQAREHAQTRQHVLAMLSPTKRLAFKVVLYYADRYFLYRENQRFYLDMIFQRWRRAFLAIGERFVAHGLLATLEDVFMLRVDEVVRIVEEGWDRSQVQETVAERRAEYAAYTRFLPPSFLRGDAGFENAPSEATGLLHGLGASPGAITAPARVLHDLSEATSLQRGEVLVTVATDPGWTPLFVGAGGLVLETGGMLSHGAIVSREYGIPAVTGVRHATRQIQSGQVITVDGNRGYIRIHEA